MYTEWPQKELKQSDIKSALHMQFLGQTSPKLSSVSLYYQLFLTNYTFYDFPIDPHVTI